MRSSGTRPIALFLAVWCLVASGPVGADYKADVDFTRLAIELGTTLPDGSGLDVSQIEATTEVDQELAWLPDAAHPEFSSVTIVDVSGALPGINSGHATTVGRKFFGALTSTSPGIQDVFAYRADHWLTDGFLQTSTGFRAHQPLLPMGRIANHSWIGSVSDANSDALARLDWVIENDEMLHVVGFTGNASSPLFSSAYNVISVNKTSAPTNSGSAAATGLYTSGRTKPEIVAPELNTSAATPRVASAASILLQAAHNNPAWSSDPLGIAGTNRNGELIYNAERVEVIKAALMAGADRFTENTSSADISDYRVEAANRTANGLDRRFGAGQLNVYNSYQMISAGEQNSQQDLQSGAGLVAMTGFDYDPAFGGSNGSNAGATYLLPTTTEPMSLTASLVWNVAIDGGRERQFDATAELYNLDLKLYDVTDPGPWILVSQSVSTTENNENLWQLLDEGRNYAILIVRGPAQPEFEWDYALAWRAESYELPAIDPKALPDGTINQAYASQTLTVSGGQAPYSWSVVTGELPPGIVLSQDGSISGTPTISTISSFTVQAADARGSTATRSFVIQVKSSSTNCCPTCHGS